VSLGLTVARQRTLSRSGTARAFRLDLVDGRTLKGRLFPRLPCQRAHGVADPHGERGACRTPVTEGR
jgi:hypothetical protein